MTTQVAFKGLDSRNGEIALNDDGLALLSKTSQPTEPDRIVETKNSIWVAPFGNFTHLKGQGVNPTIHSSLGGVLVAYDRQGDHFLIGGAVGYALNYLHYAEKVGHGTVQEEMVCLYGAYYWDHFWLDAALWGGVYQLSNERHSSFSITAKSKTRGAIFAPHFEMATPWAIDSQKRYFIEPFAMFDWVSSWQNHFTEQGRSGFNLVMPGIYGSLLQSEAGLRFYERFSFLKGDVLMEEKLSYVNQAPFFPNSVTTGFVSSASTFPIAVASTQMQNLGCIEILTTFVPRNKSYPFGGLKAQVMANTAYQSVFVSVFGGWDF